MSRVSAVVRTTMFLMCMAGMAHASEGEYKGFQSGDIMVRGRFGAVLPNVSNDTLTAIGGNADASNSMIPEVDATYFFTPNFAVEAIAAVTRHHVRDRNSTIGNVDLGHVLLLPPTVTAQYHFMPSSSFSPYVGAGINYTMFLDPSTAPGSAATSIDYKNSFGEAIQAGFDYHIQGNWYANFDVKHIFLTTHVNVNGGAINGNVSIDPTIVAFGIGYKF